MSDLLAVNGRRFEKVHLILNEDVSNAGFCALMTYALNGVRKALENNWLPVVNYDKTNCPFFYDSARGENVWEYYFEPVLRVSYADVQRHLADGSLTPEQIHMDKADDVLKWHHNDPERIATFWAKDTPADPTAWMAAKRELGRRYVADYIRVKPHIRAQVEAFAAQSLKGAYVFGAHVRGTDFAYAEPTPPEAYFRIIKDTAQRKGPRDFRVFLATDQRQFVDVFRKEYGDRLVTYDSIRSDSDVSPFRFSGVNPYKKGEDVLIDTLLLSSCDHVLKGAAAGGEYALWFNPKAEYTDFALTSRFDTRQYHLLESAYLKLNPDAAPSWRLKVRRALNVCAQYVRSGRPVLHLKRAWRFFRKLVHDDHKPMGS